MTTEPLRRILETVLYVADLPAAKRFYGGVLGLELDSEREGLFAFYRLDGAMLLLFDPSASARNTEIPAHGARGAGHVCFELPEAAHQAWQERLVAEGVPIEHAQAWPRGGRSFYVRDPAGNSVEMATGRIWGFPELIHKADTPPTPSEDGLWTSVKAD